MLRSDKLAGCALISGGRSLPDRDPTAGPVRIETPGFRVSSDREAVTQEGLAVLVFGRIHCCAEPGSRLPGHGQGQEPLVADLFIKHGIGFRSLLDGHYFILIHEIDEQRLWLINDRYRITNLYYLEHRGVLYFANSVQLLLESLPTTPPFDLRAIPSFLETGFSYTEHTWFEGMQRLLPTFCLRLEDHGVALDHYWGEEYRFERRPVGDLERSLDRYEELWRESIDGYLNQHRPEQLGCMLSGGHDTSYLFIHASEAFDRPVHGFTAAFEGFGFDEAPKARWVADRYGGVHHRVPFGPDDLDLVPAMIRGVEEPVSGSSLPIYKCARAAGSRGMDTVLAGDAGDTLWGEYYPVAEWHRYLRHLPALGRRLLHGLVRRGAELSDWERLWEAEHVLSLFARDNMYERFFGRLCAYRHYNEDLLRELLPRALFPTIDPYGCLLDLPVNGENFYDSLVETKMLYGVFPYMIPPTRKGLESLGLGFHSPYLDRGVAEFINSLPHEWLNHGSSFALLTNDALKRRFHKLALLRYLPRRFVFSVQQSMDVPFHALLKPRPGVLNRLYARLLRRGWFDPATLERIFREFPQHRVKPHEIVQLSHHGYRIYTLLTLEVWCMEFLDGRINSPLDENLSLEEYLDS